MRLSIEKQVVLIGVRGFFGVQRGSYTAVGNARELASVLLAQVNTNRWHGSFDSQPVLVRANPGTGKTWSMLQLQFFLAADTLDPSIATRANNICAKLLARKSHSTETLDEDIVDDSNSSDGSDDGSGEGDEGPDDAVADDNAKPPAAAFGEAALERERADSEYASASFIDADPGTSPASTAPQPILVPFLVLIQRLAPMFRARGSAPKRGDLSLIVEYIRTYEPEYSEMLEMALRMRTLVLLVDGLDEAAGLREVIEDYVVSSWSCCKICNDGRCCCCRRLVPLVSSCALPHQFHACPLNHAYWCIVFSLQLTVRTCACRHCVSRNQKHRCTPSPAVDAG